MQCNIICECIIIYNYFYFALSGINLDGSTSRIYGFTTLKYIFFNIYQKLLNLF